jgi:hypothetical protein
MFIHTYTSPPYELIPENDYACDIKYYAAFKANTKEIRAEITRWCYKTYGNPGFNTNTQQIRWSDGIKWGEVIFSRKEDLEWFLLRWS